MSDAALLTVHTIINEAGASPQQAILPSHADLYKHVPCLRIVPEQTAFVVERFGRYLKTLSPGLHLLIPLVCISAATEAGCRTCKAPPTVEYSKNPSYPGSAG